MKGKTILLVEDDFLNRRLTKKTLVENNYTVIESRSAAETFEILATQTPDLAILDINLGEKQQDGLSLAQEIKRQYNIPFIYLTAYDTSEVVKKAVVTMPEAYITKPFKKVDLLTSVELAILQSAGPEQNELTISVKDGSYNVELPVEEINYIESDGNYLLFYTSKNIYRTRSTIKQIIGLLPATTFIKIHRAFVINKNKVEKYSTKAVIINKTEIPISPNYIDSFITALK